MEGRIFKKLAIFLLVLIWFWAGFFIKAQESLTPSPAINYAPNLWFDSEEKYYPANPLDFYFENGEEISGQIAVQKYNQLSVQEKINNLTVLYHIEDEGSQWVYQYWFFYVFNDSKGLVKNQHYGDWEAVYVFVDKESGQVNKVIGTAHQREIFDTEIYNPKTNHIWTYVGNGSHANCVNEKDDSYCDFWKWEKWEKWDKNGIKVSYKNYKSIEIDANFVNNFHGTAGLEKSSKLGINLFDHIELKNKEFYIPLGGGSPNYAWHQSSYYNPEEIRPISRRLVAEYVSNKTSQVKNKITGFFNNVVSRVKNVFKEAELSEQPADIVNILIEDLTEENKGVIKVSIENKENVVPEIEKPKEIAQTIQVPPVVKVSEPDEEVDLLIELATEVLVSEEEDQSIIEPISPINPPAFISGGGPPPVSTAEPGDTSSPDSPLVTSPNSGDILATSSVDLIGTAEPNSTILISVNPSYSTTTDADGNWQQEISISEGENTISVKAEDSAGNQSEETLITLTCDTISPSSITDLSATSGNNRGEINLSWTAPGANQYIIKYATSSEITSLNWASSTDIVGEPTPGSASSTENLIVSDLDTSQIYYWGIRSQDAVGNLSEISNSASTSPYAQANSLVISEIQVKGTVANDEFIELYNPTDQNIDLSSWSIQYRGSGSSSFKKKNFVNGNSIPTHGYFLIANSDYDGHMQADMSHNSFQISATGGNIFLVNNQTLLTDASDNSIIDKIAYGSGTYLFPETTKFSSSPDAEQSLERKNSNTSTADLLAVNGDHHWSGNNWDGNNNSSDFVLQTSPNPQNSLSLTESRTSFASLADTTWPMLQSNLQHTGLSLYSNNATGSPTSTPKWTVDLSTNQLTSPVISSDGSIYVGAGSGDFHKVTMTGSASRFYDTGTDGTVQTPVISSDGVIYLTDNYYLYALTSDGQLIWKYSITNTSEPTIGSDGTIYIASDYFLYALTQNGEKIWQSPQLSNGRWIRSPAIDSNGNIYTVGKISSCSNCKVIYALNPSDGSITWQTNSGPYFTTLSLDNQNTLYVGGYLSSGSSGLCAINSSDGSQKWSNSIGDISYSIPAINQNIVYIGTDGHIFYAINTTDGNTSWIFVFNDKITASPIVDSNGIIYIGGEDKMFYAFNSDGTIKWQAELSDKISYGAVIGSDGTVYAVTIDGKLHAFGE